MKIVATVILNFKFGHKEGHSPGFVKVYVTDLEKMYFAVHFFVVIIFHDVKCMRVIHQRFRAFDFFRANFL